jgi:hypothetical protein
VKRRIPASAVHPPRKVLLISRIKRLIGRRHPHL